METLLSLILAALIFIGYRIMEFEKKWLKEIGKKSTPTLSTSLNPLFSEEDIASARERRNEWSAMISRYDEQLFKAEKREIAKHHNSRKGKADFNPSDSLKNDVLRVEYAEQNYLESVNEVRKKIEANISIMNGKSIEEASEQYVRSPGKISIHWQNPAIEKNPIAWSRLLEDEYEKALKKKMDYWLGSWDQLVKYPSDKIDS
jgi:hypothetical protein